MRFVPPGEAGRVGAIGQTGALPEGLRRAFDPGADFEPVPEPAVHDWLANHPEAGQSFDRFVRSRPNRPEPPRNRVYLQPLDEFRPDGSPSLELLRQFAEAFFCLPARLLPVIVLDGDSVTRRANPDTGHLQLLTGDILELLKGRLPGDGYCILGITMHDLYPHPSWNFVFGQASLTERVGVYSFARYDPRFYGLRSRDPARLLLRRSCKVLAHETAHMFGIEHCIFFKCVMNGSNHLRESDSRPLHLCPVDLRKLHHAVRFDVADRYRRLEAFCRAAGFDEEARWLAARLAHVEGGRAALAR